MQLWHLMQPPRTCMNPVMSLTCSFIRAINDSLASALDFSRAEMASVRLAGSGSSLSSNPRVVRNSSPLAVFAESNISFPESRPNTSRFTSAVFTTGSSHAWQAVRREVPESSVFPPSFASSSSFNVKPLFFESETSSAYAGTGNVPRQSTEIRVTFSRFIWCSFASSSTARSSQGRNTAAILCPEVSSVVFTSRFAELEGRTKAKGLAETTLLGSFTRV